MEETKTKKAGFASKIPRFMKRKRFYIPALIVLAIVVWSTFFAGNGAVPNFETATVERGSVLRVVNESGTVAAADEVDLAFTASGRIASVLVGKGDTVVAGQTLVRLESAQAQAALRAAEARLSSSGGTFAQTSAQHNQLVANARAALTSGDLQAYLVSGGYSGNESSYAQPTVTGTYRCSAEGEYRLTLYPSSTDSGYSFRVSGLEGDTGAVSVFRPEPIGQCGLFIQFPENFLRGGEIVWSVPVPNVRSASYVSRLGAYEASLEARELALQSSNNSQVLLADVDQARAVLAGMTLVAPFGGIVTDLSATLGQIASPGSPVLSLTSVGRFEISVQVPEDDIMDIDPGDRVEVTFDALRDIRLEGRVAYVAPAASRASGFAAFEVIVHLIDEDPSVRSGLTADVDIFADSREDVVVVPVRAVIEEDGHRFVRIMEGESSYYRVPVSVGLRGGGSYEITSGLSGGERIITFANTAALDALTDLGERETGGNL